jgi:ABC-type transport system substrate-binding protein
MQAHWGRHLDVHATIEVMEWAGYLQHMRKSPAYIVGWNPDYPDPDGYLRGGVYKHAGWWHNSDYERLIQAAAHSTDQAERLRLYQDADRILVEEAAIVPLD